MKDPEQSTAPFEAPSIASAVLEEDGRVCLTFDNMALGFVYSSGSPDGNGFTLEDETGVIPFTAFQAAREDKNRIYLTPQRAPGVGAVISFAWEADPVRFPVTDEVTFLPPLSFYRYPVTQ